MRLRFRAALLFTLPGLLACRVPSPTPPPAYIDPDDTEIAQAIGAVPKETDEPEERITPAGPIAIHVTADTLSFALVGDTRPSIPDDTHAYPTEVIHQIWRQIAAARPDFVVGTGDYMFATARSKKSAGKQLDLFLDARSVFRGSFYPAMGNHECTGLTGSNCGVGSSDGYSRPYSQYLRKMLAPVGMTRPYYTLFVHSRDGSWTAKLVFVAANAWNADQEDWLQSAWQEPATYSFLVRHEGAHAHNAPGVDPSQRIVDRLPSTLTLVGHVHTYRHDLAAREVVVGNGGAPMVDSTAPGFATVRRRPDGAIEVNSIRASDGSVVDRFAVKADGSPAS